MLNLNAIFKNLFFDFIKPETYKTDFNFSQPIKLVIAISGAAALGKSYFSENLKEFLESHGIQSTYISLDGYLLNRKYRQKKKLSGYDPKANNLKKMINDLNSLILDSNEIAVPLYDHKLGKHIGNETKIPNPVVILDGIMALHYEIRKFSNIKIFMSADLLTLKGLRILEDKNNRGYTIVEAVGHAESEYENYLKWIEHQESLSDVIITVNYLHEYGYKINEIPA